ncbi:MAG TPA: hypothetical protein VKX17_08875 [Planctomycetota bacterium]|nr:hypothetical protein [Planctomycetota bacterium]
MTSNDVQFCNWKRPSGKNRRISRLTGNATGNVSGSSATFSGQLVGDVTGTQSATVVSTVGGVAAINVASGANLANAASNLNTASAIAKRDASGNFSAGAITGNLTGNVTGNVNGSAASFTGNLVGDVIGTQSATVVSTVGAVTAANVASGATLANSATAANTSNTIVKRDASGNFSVGTISGNLIGNVTGNVSGSAGSFTGNLAGDVTGAQAATMVSTVGGVTATNVASGANLANAATNLNTVSTVVKRDASGNFNAGTITASVTGNVSGTATNVTGVVQIANGGTGSPTQNFVDLSSNQATIGGNKTFTGTLTLSGDPTANLQAATKQYVDAEKARAQTAESAKVAKAGDTMTGALILPTDGLTAGTSQLVLANGNVGIGTNASQSNTLVVQKTVGLSDPSAQHQLQAEIRSGINVVNPMAMALGVLDNGQGMIQVKQVNVGYSDLLIQPVRGNVCIGTQTAAASCTINNNGGGAMGVTLPNVIAIQFGGGNVARIDNSGKGFFNGGTQTGGADLAEAFEVEGDRLTYSSGDVLMISKTSNRTVTKSDGAYSTLVAGVYATKPGVLLTEKGIDASLSDTVPMGVVGVIPTKVCAENGAIRRGDLLVTSSTVGHAMKGTDRNRMLGAIIGKALEDFDGKESGTILVLVNVK